MREQLQIRLQELKAEFASGQQVLANLEAKQTNLQSTLLRIQGAIQVLEEELAQEEIEFPKESELPNRDESLANTKVEVLN